MRVPMTILRRCAMLFFVVLGQHCGSQALWGQSLSVLGDQPASPACTRGWAACVPPRSGMRVPVTIMRRCGLLYIVALEWHR